MFRILLFLLYAYIVQSSYLDNKEATTAMFIKGGERIVLLENEKSTKLSLDRKILSLWNTLQRTDGQISSIGASVAANEMALQGVRREVEVGTRTTLDLLNAENEYVQAQASLISAVHDKSQSHFSLMFECGLLDEAFAY